MANKCSKGKKNQFVAIRMSYSIYTSNAYPDRTTELHFNANAPAAQWCALPSWRPPARVRFPIWDRSGVAPGIFPRGVPGGVCVRVYRCVCVIPGRRVLGLPGSPSALSARSAWVPNMSSYMPASAPGNVQKKNISMECK